MEPPRPRGIPLTSAETLCYPYIGLQRHNTGPGMTPQTNRIEVTLESMIESVDLAEGIVMRVCAAVGFPEEETHKIGMSVREGVINAFHYGNREDRHKKIFLTVELDPEKLTVRVLDQGPGFVVEEVPDPLSEENLLRTSGRGIFLMRAFMDEFEVICRPEGGAELVMAKRLPAGGNGNLRKAHDKEQ
jgi:serine/threonine-protein kinase RsbW